MPNGCKTSLATSSLVRHLFQAFSPIFNGFQVLLAETVIRDCKKAVFLGFMLSRVLCLGTREVIGWVLAH